MAHKLFNILLITMIVSFCIACIACIATAGYIRDYDVEYTDMTSNNSQDNIHVFGKGSKDKAWDRGLFGEVKQLAGPKRVNTYGGCR